MKFLIEGRQALCSFVVQLVHKASQKNSKVLKEEDAYFDKHTLFHIIEIQQLDKLDHYDTFALFLMQFFDFY